jgi:hypothetical protein
VPAAAAVSSCVLVSFPAPLLSFALGVVAPPTFTNADEKNHTCVSPF